MNQPNTPHTPPNRWQSFQEHTKQLEQKLYSEDGLKPLITLEGLIREIPHAQEWTNRDIDHVLKTALIATLQSATHQELLDALKQDDNTINTILDYISREIDKLKNTKATAQEILEKFQIQFRQYKNQIVGTDKQVPINEKGNKQFEQTEIPVSKLGLLIEYLRKQHIYSDDIFVCIGENKPKTRRETTYFLIEIPRLNRGILICEDYGEATYIIDLSEHRETIFAATKRQLKECHGAISIELNLDDLESWYSNIHQAIFGDNIDSKEKLDLQDFDALRATISPKIITEHILKSEDINTPEKWMNLKGNGYRGQGLSKPTLKVLGMGLHAIATIFGVQGNPIGSRYTMAQLGIKIFGPHPAFNLSPRKKLPPVSQEDITLEVSQNEEINTPEKWMALIIPNEEIEAIIGERTTFKSTMKICDRGLHGVARIFGILGNPEKSPKVMAELGRKMFGEHPIFEIPSAIENIKAPTTTEIIEAIITNNNINTPEKWMSILHRYKYQMRLKGLTLFSVAKLFGLTESPNRSQHAMAELGKIIFKNPDHPAFQVPDKSKITIQDIERAISTSSDINTPEGWMQLTATERSTHKIGGLTLRDIAKLYNLPLKPNRSRSDMAELGKIILKNPDHPAFQIEETPEANQEEIVQEVLATASINTLDKWIALTQKEKLKLKICGLGLYAIAGKFGIKGNPSTSSAIMKELGEIIFSKIIFREDTPS
ncbi:hypothetical protein CVV38_02725 [Candidatus Peregrinibacteria bacterium HGW-Peregrinibacteria-1]|jgi:hypothetical protein|nr:MAG: hypothetical protein CVV38_02725 [Candidatus Peregrinibacteria bacterium HGW-Peregrinibacteria-1]